VAPRDHRGSGPYFRPTLRLYQKVQRASLENPEGFDAAKFIWKLSSDNEMLMVPVPDIYPSTQEAAGQVRGWLARCEQSPEHIVCTRTRLHIGLPKRVLDLTTSDNTIYLYESQGEIKPYAALSYSWGSGVPLKTTSGNLAQHKNISIPELPETLRDAMLFTKNLGFQYL